MECVHGFADDSQLSKHMQVNEVQMGKCAIVDCISAIELWWRSHGLKLNAYKSDVIYLSIIKSYTEYNKHVKEKSI